MTQETQLSPPPVIWAQRSKILYVTICLEDCKNPTLKVEADKVYFKGTGGTDKKDYEVTINLYGKIDPDKTVQQIRDRIIEIILTKQDVGPFWPRLTKESQKLHWLKSDFHKWVDENESSEDDEHDIAQMFRTYADHSKSPFNGKPEYNTLESPAGESTDSDDDDMPDLE